MATNERSNGAMRDYGNVLPPARIKVVGAGGGGSNAINRMIEAEVRGVEFICVNTDIQALDRSLASTKVRLGEKLTRGLGAGGNPNVGSKAAEESSDELHALLKDSDMVFITAGMGGGTGTGSIPVIAQIAQEVGALTVAVVTKPFTFEGPKRRAVAEEGINNLKEHVDTLITIPNDRLLQIVEKKTSIDAAFRIVDDVLRQGIQGISELITVPGLINLDFADVKTIMSQAGSALMAIGHGSGENRAVDAARMAVASPLLDVSIDGAKGVLFNITGSADLSLMEISDAAEVIAKAADPDANIIFGAVVDPDLKGEVKITVIATGFEQKVSLPASRNTFSTGAPARETRPRYDPSADRDRDRDRDREPRPDGGAQAPTPLKVREVQIPNFQGDDTDIPAFLRRR